MPNLSFTIFTAKHGAVTFESPYATEQALAVIHDLVSNSFAQSLYANRAKLSEKQAAWVHKLAVDATAPKPKAPETPIDASGLLKLFAHASTHLKFPRIALRADGVNLLLRLCGPDSRRPGSISITAKSGFMGRITVDGVLQATNMTPAMRDAIVKFAADPRAGALEYGRQTDHCCFCGLLLTDDRSVAAGYGPICAEHYGLPWEETPELLEMLKARFEHSVQQLAAAGKL
jgi:hypothetical protein